MKDNYCVIMAGGIGSRFWPMSRSSFPKQFHDILGTGKTLIQMTFDRFLAVCPKENILVVTNEKYKDLVLKQIPEIKEDQILCEPSMKNTAACVAYSNYHILSKNPNAKIVVAPSDHLITNEVEFHRIIEKAVAQADEKCLVTLGIKPHRPDTGYGYINYESINSEESSEIKQVKAFEEKPNLEKAQKFVDSGDYLWNSGIFIWSLNQIINEFEQHLPEMHQQFEDRKSRFGSAQEFDCIAEIYEVCQSISIDYGVMEKAQNVKVIPSDFGWSDLGTWGSLSTHIQPDSAQNSTVGKTLLSNSKNNLVFSSTEGKLIALEGVSDMIVVDTADALLICPKDKEQEIKGIVNQLKDGKNSSFS